ncbi:MAG: RibD family protein, partial [Planctomycetota bacterium]
AGAQPLRAVVCGRGSLPPRARLLRDRWARLGGTVLVAPTGWRAPQGARVLRCGACGRVDLRRLLRALYREGVRRVLVEGGPTLLASFLETDLVDHVSVFLAPKLAGRSTRMAGARRVTPLSLRRIEEDLLAEGFLSRR